jgi:hypothetical protein
VPDVEAWTHFTELLAALVDATHERAEAGSSFDTALAAFVRLVEADAAARLADVPDGAAPPLTPLSDPGIRQLLGGLIDLAGYSSGQGEDFRELRDLLISFETTAPDTP